MDEKFSIARPRQHNELFHPSFVYKKAEDADIRSIRRIQLIILPYRMQRNFLHSLFVRRFEIWHVHHETRDNRFTIVDKLKAFHYLLVE